MNKSIYHLCFFLLVFVLSATGQTSIPGRGSEMCSHRKIQNGLIGDRSCHSAGSPVHAFDVIKYTINIDLVNCLLSPYPNSFNADVKILFRIDSTLNEIELNAVNSSLSISAVQLNGVSFTHNNDILKIQLDRTYNPGEQAEVKVLYSHADVSDGAFYTSGGFVFTDCEPEGARKWFPCYDKPSDKALTDITAKVPVGAKLGSNGKLLDSVNNGSNLTYHWVSRDPVATYLTVITASTNYNLDIVNWTNPNTSEIIQIRFYYNPGENPSNIKNKIGAMTTYFSEEFGDHPFEKNGFATLNNEFTWGGMENQTLTSLCPNCWGESLIAHEFAHQWFGDMITCATWADIFLNEGFATWAEAYWTEHYYGYEEYKNELAWNAEYYKAYNPGWAISVPSWAVTTPGLNTLFNYAITYMKGSCVLHMLRYTLGDNVYFPAIKAYATDTVDFKYKSATIGDFKNKMESESGQELDWFFDQWIYMPDHPVYRNEFSIAQGNPGSWFVFFEANQEAKSFLPYFQMPLEILVNFKDGTDSIVRVFNSFNGQNFSFEFNKEPDDIIFDPNNDILLKEGTTIVSLDENPGIEKGFSFCASPNPFHFNTKLTYEIESPAFVTIELYNNMGVKLKTLIENYQTPGGYSLNLETDRLARGIYYAVLRTPDHIESLKIVKAE